MPSKARHPIAKAAGAVRRRGGDVLSTLRDNLAREISARGKDMKGASIEAGVGETFVRDVIVREQDPRISNLAMLARRHGISIDALIGLHEPGAAAGGEIKIVGEVGAGLWRELDESGQIDFERETSPFPPDPRYPTSAQFDLVVRGSSINRFARDGERLRCVDVVAAGIEVLDNDLVIFRKTKDDGSLVETTAKRIRKRGSIVELWPDSDDPRWQTPIKLDARNAEPDTEGRIVALVLYSYNPASAARR